MYKDIECNKNESPDLFKAQLFALTGVLPERQKVNDCTIFYYNSAGFFD